MFILSEIVSFIKKKGIFIIQSQKNMGLSIHYQGYFKNAKDLPLMIEEVLTVAKANHWKYFIFENEFPNSTFTQKPDKEKLYGICVSPPECEMVSFSFLSNGKMCGVEKLQINKHVENIEEDENLYYLHTKTQYAGIEIHKKIILLFDYLSTTYFEQFKLYDEGQFWETRDEQLLTTIFNRYTNLTESFQSSLENTPITPGESPEDYVLRMAEFVQKNNPMEDNNQEEEEEEEFPKLDIHDENEFKKLKLSIEHGAGYFSKGSSNLPPEIEGQFLDYIANFENASKNAKQITVFKKLGEPEYKPESTLTNDEITIELEKIELLMQNHGMNLDVLADYTDEERLIYKFITEELFEHEITDMNIPGLQTCFIYEEFHPNHEYDLKRDTEDFLRMFFNTKDDYYKRSHNEEATNHIALNNFRSLFKEFQMTFFEFQEITFDEQDAVVRFNIDFWAKIKDTDDKMNYSGNGNLTFKSEYGYWYLREVTLPIHD